LSARRVVYVLGSAAPPIFDIEQLLRLLQDRGWQPCLILTPTAAEWIEASHMGEIAGCPVRVNPRQPGETESLPPADAVLATPITFNSVNKWAAGINDTLALGLLNELLCEEVPIVAAPCVKATLQRHPVYIDNVSRLERSGVYVLKSEETVIRQRGSLTLSWPLVIEALESIK
jgi:phosphopantothenoylcysteine synthetase/decarboxylase